MTEFEIYKGDFETKVKFSVSVNKEVTPSLHHASKDTAES